jgi:heptosyltransferase-2
LGRVKRRVGYKRDGRGVLLTDRVPATPEILRVHQVDYYLNLLRDFCDPAAQDSNLVLPAAPDALDQLRRRFQKLDIPLYGDRPLAALCPGAAFGSAKRWPAERFAAVADHLNAKWNARVLVLGAKSEWEVCEEICRKAQSPVLNLAGQNPLREMIALCPFLSVIVCNDSGPMHVAAACGTPLVAVFGPTDSTTTGPWSPNAVVVKNPCECPDVPCMRRECDFPTHACMLAVGADDVSAEVDKMMQKGRRSVAETT